VAGGFAQRLARCAGLAESLGRVRRSEEATGLWVSVYQNLSGEEGVAARAEVQVARLSLLYALLDESARVEAVHIDAALAVWAYCEASVRYLFRAGEFGGQGNPALGDLLSERVLGGYKRPRQHSGGGTCQRVITSRPNLSAQESAYAYE
jgi:hypothetical protein